MHNHQKCQKNVWILSGTADGPILAEMLLGQGFIVFVSVVTYKASMSYKKHSKLHIITGQLTESKQITDFIFKNNIQDVIDATHPFAMIISNNLKEACENIKVNLFRLERNYENKMFSAKKIISDFREVGNNEIVNKNILLAIGSRSLDLIAQYYLDHGANIFARVIATPESISKAFSSCIKSSNIAILNPSKDIEMKLEKKLCSYWSIDYVICRESGGYSQKIWEDVCFDCDIQLFLLKRPSIINQENMFCNYDDLINEIIDKKNIS